MSYTPVILALGRPRQEEKFLDSLGYIKTILSQNHKMGLVNACLAYSPGFCP